MLLSSKYTGTESSRINPKNLQVKRGQTFFKMENWYKPKRF